MQATESTAGKRAIRGSSSLPFGTIFHKTTRFFYRAFFIVPFALIVCASCTWTHAHAGWSDDWIVNGIPLSRFRDAGPAEYAQFAGGVLTAGLVHVAGHEVCASIFGIGIDHDGLFRENFSGLSTTDAEKAWFGRSGFLFQLAVGLGLDLSPWESSFFATGYHAGSAIQIMSYPIRDGDGDQGDLDAIDKHGSADIEYLIYSGAALWMLIY